MKKLVCLGLAAVLTAGLLSGCGSSEETVRLNVYNVGDYIDEDVLDIFEEENPGIKINYETYYTNEEMYVKVANGGSDYDVVFPSDYMVQKMADEGLLNKLNYDNIPNYSNVGDQYKGMDYDPNEEYTVPYMWGTMGILYNKTMVDEPVTSWKILWDEKYEKNIFMLDSERDTLGITLKMLGYSMNTGDDQELNEALNALIEQKPLVLAYAGDEVKDKMINGEGAMTVAWSGDAFYCIEQNPDLAYAVPEEGSNIWFDAMAIPTTSKHQAEAEKFIDFMCRPDIALRNAEYIGYSTVNTAAQEMLDDEVKNDPLRYPDLSTLTGLEVFKYDKELTQKYSDLWQKLKVSN